MSGRFPTHLLVRNLVDCQLELCVGHALGALGLALGEDQVNCTGQVRRGCSGCSGEEEGEGDAAMSIVCMVP